MKIEIKETSFEIGRVAVLLGANGSGKSTELKKIVSSSPGDVFYIEGGRTIGLPTRLDSLTQDGQDITSVESEYNRSKKTSLAGRIQRRLGLLYKKSRDTDLAWVRALKNDPSLVSKIPKTKIDDLTEIFTDVFPEIQLKINEKSESIEAFKNGGDPYPISKLSDGEKQCLAIILDLMTLDDEPSIVVVDEPEINLHPYLAINLWNAVESKLAGTTFIYGTHLIQFSLRENVGDIITLSGKYDPVKIVPEEWIHSEHINELLFALPGVFASSKVLFCEGKDKYQSEKLFYEWLLNNKTIRVEPLSGRNSVIAAASKAEVFSKISTGISVAGVIDSDYRGQMQRLPDNIKELPFHEFETIFCLPSIFNTIIKALENEKIECSVLSIQNDICEWASSNRKYITSQYLAYRFGFRIGVSLSRKEVDEISTNDEMIQKYTEMARIELEKASTKLQLVEIKRCFKEIDDKLSELQRKGEHFEEQCYTLIGKECLQALCQKYNVKRQTIISKGMQIIDASSINILAELKNELIKIIG
jgi:hypothetical protein